VPLQLARTHAFLYSLAHAAPVLVPEPLNLTDAIRWSDTPGYQTAFTALHSALGGGDGMHILTAGGEPMVVHGVETADGVERPALGISRFMRLLSWVVARFGGVGHARGAEGHSNSTRDAVRQGNSTGGAGTASSIEPGRLAGAVGGGSEAQAALQEAGAAGAESEAEPGGDPGAPLRSLPGMLDRELFLIIPGVLNMSVSLDALLSTGLDSFDSFLPFAPMPGEEDAHSLAFKFGLDSVGVEADITVRSYPLSGGTSDLPGPMFVHPTGAPLTLSTRAAVSAAEVAISGAMLLGINATALGRTQLWQLTRPACLARVVLAAGLRRLSFDFDASSASILMTPIAQPDGLLGGFTRLINDAAAVALVAFPGIIEDVVSGLARAPMVSALNQLAMQLLTPSEFADSCDASPPVPRRADWRMSPETPDISELASRALRHVDAPLASEALRVLGLTGLYVPGRVFAGTSDSIFMSRMGMGVVELEVRDFLLTGLDRLSSLSLLRTSPDAPLALDTALGLGDGAGALTAAMEVRMAARGRNHSYDVRMEFRQVELRLRALVDVWRNLVGYAELGELASACGALPLARLAWDADHCGITFAGDDRALTLSMRGSQAAAAAGVSGETALGLMRGMGSAVGLISADVADGALASAHDSCAQADAPPDGKASATSRRTALSSAAASMRTSGQFAELDQRSAPAAAALHTLQLALARISSGAELRAAPNASADGDGAGAASGGVSDSDEAVVYPGWDQADPIFVSLCALLLLAALAASWLRWRRSGLADALWAGALSGYLPRYASAALTLSMLVNLFLLFWVRAMPYPQMTAVVSVAGEELASFSALDFPSMAQFASRAWAERQYTFALVLWLSCGLWPYLKLALAMLCLHAPHRILTRQRRRLLLEGCNFGAKWTRVHVDLVALLLLMCTLRISVGGVVVAEGAEGVGAEGGAGGAPDSYTHAPSRVLSELDAAGATTEVSTPPMMAMSSDMDPAWPVRQLLLLMLAIVLSQLVMVAHHCESEAHRAEGADIGGEARGIEAVTEAPAGIDARAGATSDAQAGMGARRDADAGAGKGFAEGSAAPTGVATASCSPDIEIGDSPHSAPDRERREERNTPTSDVPASPPPPLGRCSRREWPVALPAVAVSPRPLRSLPLRCLAPADGKGSILSERLPVPAQWAITLSLVLSIALLVCSLFVPILTISMTGLPRFALSADERDKQLSLASMLVKLGHTVPNDVITRTTVQASHFLAVMLAPFAFQTGALYLWTRPLLPRARRAAALAVRLLFAWCGIDVFLCLLVCIFVLSLREQMSAEISASKGCDPIEPLMRAYFGAALGMHSESDHCIGFSPTFHLGFALLVASLALQYALAFFVLGASELAVEGEEDGGRGGKGHDGRSGVSLRSIGAVADEEGATRDAPLAAVSQQATNTPHGLTTQAPDEGTTGTARGGGRRGMDTYEWAVV
jgi:hypothetical protein